MRVAEQFVKIGMNHFEEWGEKLGVHALQNFTPHLPEKFQKSAARMINERRPQKFPNPAR
jgi:hypothetical protein